jgi:hypothetical protein
MAWLQPLDSITPEELATLGDRPYYLGQLQQRPWPVVTG